MSDHCCSIQAPSEDEPTLKKVLWIVFAINAGMFLIEFISGRLYHSAALMADSLDMLSDAIVYGVSILVLAKNNQIKAKVSLFKGVLMLGMALYVVYELVTKFFQPVLPAGQIVSGVGLMAFVANAVCLWLLFQYKRGDINIRSAWVCSRNDMVANVGVITAGGLVLYSGSQWPDYLIGAAVALFVLVTSLQVITDSVSELKLSK